MKHRGTGPQNQHQNTDISFLGFHRHFHRVRTALRIPSGTPGCVESTTTHPSTLILPLTGTASLTERKRGSSDHTLIHPLPTHHPDAHRPACCVRMPPIRVPPIRPSQLDISSFFRYLHVKPTIYHLASETHLPHPLHAADSAHCARAFMDSSLIRRGSDGNMLVGMRPIPYQHSSMEDE